MSDESIPEEPPEETEIYEQYDEAADDPGATGVSGSEADLTRFTEMPLDTLENDELGAGLDDPEQMAMLDGGMDDPDGIDPAERD